MGESPSFSVLRSASRAAQRDSKWQMALFPFHVTKKWTRRRVLIVWRPPRWPRLPSRVPFALVGPPWPLSFSRRVARAHLTAWQLDRQPRWVGEDAELARPSKFQTSTFEKQGFIVLFRAWEEAGISIMPWTDWCHISCRLASGFRLFYFFFTRMIWSKYVFHSNSKVSNVSYPLSTQLPTYRLPDRPSSIVPQSTRAHHIFCLPSSIALLRRARACESSEWVGGRARARARLFDFFFKGEK